MEEGREALHDQEDGHGQGGKGGENEEQRQTSCQALHAEADVDHHGPEHLRQLWGMQRQDIGSVWQEVLWAFHLALPPLT